LHKSESATISQSCPAKDLQHLGGKSRLALFAIVFGSVVRIEEHAQMKPQGCDDRRTRVAIGRDGEIVRILCG
jgi:hypothetical protein